MVNDSAKCNLELRSAYRVQQLLIGYLLGIQASLVLGKVEQTKCEAGTR